ncbi:MAG: flagellar biosynthetic protein FliR [Planctomycetota bacterium]
MPVPVPDPALLVVVGPAAGAALRIAVATAVKARTACPGVPVQVVTCLVLALVLAASPALAKLATATGDGAAPLPLLLAGEAACGAVLGLIAGAALGIGGSAGSLLAGTTGLSWDDDLPAGDPQAPGLARLAWWVGAAAFLATGGVRGMVAALLDSLHTFPVGVVANGLGTGPGAGSVALLERLPGLLVELALGLAAPALVAVVAFHFSTAICLRAVGLAPGPGLVAGVVGAALLATLLAAAPAWSGQAAAEAAVFLERATT